ncbi:transketolase [Candidatus Aerophobetes bacterium]|nr:transketolase [Candidatus Aerophobetes bacterium]
MPDLIDPRKAFADTVVELAKENRNILAVSADSAGSAHLGEFRKLFPHQYLEFGLMEPSIVGFCAGLALSGKIPFFCAITPFITMRAFEQVRNDLAYNFANVKIVGRNSGLTNDRFGPTHHSLEDVALMRSLPGMVVIVPSDPHQVREYVKKVALHKGPCYIRLGSVKIPFIYDSFESFEIGKGKVFKKGKDITVITCGITLWYTLEALKILEKESSLDVQVVDMPSVKPLDEELLFNVARNTSGILVVEEHSTVGGLGGAVCEFLSQNIPVPVKLVGVPDIFATSGPYMELMERYDLSPAGIYRKIKAFAESLGLKK